MELGVLGPLQVRQYGLPVGIPGAKPRAILTMLGLHGGSVVPAGTLVELLWGTDPPRTAAKALQTHISALRRTLGDGFVLTEGAGWTLSTTEIDASRYKSAVKSGREAVAAGDISRAVERFDQALALWRGVPELPDGPRGGSEKTRWIEGHAALVEDRADALLATGRAAEIIGELEAAVADAPLRERRWGQLMLALYRAGRQGEALGAYQRARALLADELGVDPGPELRRLEAAIVAQDDALETPVSQQLSVVTRAVTFLLTDIEGSTAAWEADADAMAVALARHDEIVGQVVTARGGRLVKTRGEGDATFSVFDRPSAAAAAAIELQNAIHNEPWALADPMRIRAALHTGEVELRDGDYFGRAVNRAARLRSLAAGGQILCSGATAELVIDSLADDVVLADLGTRQLRNLSRPEHVFELRLAIDDESRAVATDTPMARPPLPAVLAAPGPFVGRGRELELLLSTWQTTLAAGAHAVLIAGEPGVGKTRLAGEWSRLAYNQNAVVLYGRCDEDLGAPYQPFAEALRSLVPCVGADRLRQLRGVEALLPLVPGLTDVLPDLAARPRADPDTERYALFDAVVALLGVASTCAPVVLILDDLHWAAKPTLLLLRHLLRFGEQARVQIVGTYRSTDLDRSHPLAAMLADLHRDGSDDRLHLRGLDEEDVSAYVAEAGYDDEELARALASVTGGNPFFLIEALRHVAESGGRWDPDTLPQGVREAVSRRLSRLSAETNKALAAAAVVGSRFALDLVEQVIGDDLVDAFDEAYKAGIVVEEPGGCYRFNHAIVRQSLLAELASVRRMRLHQRIAATLEATAGEEHELLAELAYHYFECAWAGNAAKAVEYCRRAADQAMARLAYEGAAELYDRALHALEELDDELPDRDDVQAELLVARCEALLAAGDVTSAVGAVSQLQSTTRDSPRLAAWGACFDGQLSMLTRPERLDEIESALAVAAEEFAALEDAAGEATAHTVRAGCLARLGRIADCEMALDHALTAARRAREHRRVNAVLANAPLAALWGPNPVPRAGGRCLDVVRLLRITTGSPVVEATSTRCQGVLDAFRGRAAAGRSLIESARRTLTELGLRHALLEVDHFAGIVELVADDPAAAEPYLRRACLGFRRMGIDTDTAETAALLARACLAMDRNVEADELCAESERLAGHALRASIAWRTVRAQLLARSGAHDEAKRVAQEAVAIAGRTDALVDHGDACLALATVLHAAGDSAGARAAAEQASGLYERKGAAALLEKARTLLGARAGAPDLAPDEPCDVQAVNACVRAGNRLIDAVNRQAWDEVEELLAPRVSVESRRRIVGFPQTDVPSSRWPQDMRGFLDTGMVHYHHTTVAMRGERLALTRLGISTADLSSGAPQDEMLHVAGLDGNGRIAMQVWFDVEDMDAAVAELDAAHARSERRNSLANPASRADARLNALFADRQWDEIGELFTDDICVEDRRRGVRRVGTGRAKMMAEVRATADVGAATMTSEVIAVRGERLALVRTVYRGRDTRPDAFYGELLRITEIDADDRIAAFIAFDLDEIDTALEELNARFLAGEAAPYADVWQEFVAVGRVLNRHQPGVMAEKISEFVDHRRIPFAPDDIGHVTDKLWALLPDARYRIAAVHALDAHGAVINLVIEGNGAQGNQMLWSATDVVTFEAGRTRLEVFDEDDLDAALARFEELRPQQRRIDNAAGRVVERYLAHFASRDWDAIRGVLSEDFVADDRRRIVNGVRHGRDAEIANERVSAELGCTEVLSTIIATRGEHLVLEHHAFVVHDRSAPVVGDALDVVEINAEKKIVALVVFDPDDVEAAFEELDARFVAGEAAAHAHTWSVIRDGCAALNRHEAPATTVDFVSVDHRSGITFTAGDLIPYIHSAFELAPEIAIHIEAVHHLSNAGVVVTHAARGTSPDDFHAEWRGVTLLTVDGDAVNRCEIFDETDLESALARLRELSSTTSRLENAASRTFERFNAYLAVRDWTAMAQMITDDICHDDRRRVVSGGLHRGRDAQIANLRAVVEVGVTNLESTVIATRGERLALTRSRVSGSATRSDAFNLEMLTLIEIDANAHITAGINFDLQDLDAAFEELDARYLAGEAAAHSHTWSLVARTFTALNKHEVPATTPDWVHIDHRPIPMYEVSDLPTYLGATWDLTPESTTYVETVHRLTDCGAVVTNVARAISKEGFEVEWREVSLITFEGDKISRGEDFDEADIDAALATFDELTAAPHLLGNAATQARTQLAEAFNRRDMDRFLSLHDQNGRYDDRRKGLGDSGKAAPRVVQAVLDAPKGWRMEVEPVAIRGSGIGLTRERWRDTSEDDQPITAETLMLTELGDDGLIRRTVLFDPDDNNGAIAELTARWLASGEVAHPAVIEAASQGNEAYNRHDWDAIAAMEADAAYVNHRQLTSEHPETIADHWRSIRALTSLIPDMWVDPAEILAHSATCVVSHVIVRGTTVGGTAIELPAIILIVFDASRVARMEAFDLSQRDTALGRFAELSSRAQGPANAAIRTWTRIVDTINRRDVEAFRALSSADGQLEDRRKGLHASHVGLERRRAAEAMCRAPDSWRLEVEPVAIRGKHLGLTRERWRDMGETDRPVTVESLTLTEVAEDELAHNTVIFDPEDMNGALAELTARWLASREVTYPEVIEAHLKILQQLNRHDWPAWRASIAGATYLNHRQLGAGETVDDFSTSVAAIASLIPNVWVEPTEIIDYSASGVLSDLLARGTSADGTDVEIPMVMLGLFDGGRLSHFEMFDSNQRDFAVARFWELDQSTR
ncbi:hypothetical protein A5724_18815 [Mycobacterium sp. ACS1612]|uniref:BTAD domain-containing putative transcriptional regulator n=1 Tax=Mycobacterium sp. ACS1612 TaxID=1834117 RepID=UPI0007FFA5D2|nr:hypothetical protein A5724_18815 [Mycobacterium sp. ACS1612]